tara:strand:- start:3823 stop:3957 length:135 start_codon:yes stop_codon:yes gene_type:complete
MCNNANYFDVGSGEGAMNTGSGIFSNTWESNHPSNVILEKRRIT